MVWGGAVALQLLGGLSLDEVPRVAAARLDLPVLGIGALASLATIVMCGLVPIIGLGAVNPAAVIGAHSRGSLGGRRGATLRMAIVATQVALAALLLTGGGLLLRSVANLSRVDPGFRATNVLTMDVTLPGARYRDPLKRTAFFRELLAQTSSLPGVVAVGANRYFRSVIGNSAIPSSSKGVPYGPARSQSSSTGA